MPGVPNAFEACVFTFGICQAGGAGKVLAEWVTEGATEWDMWSCDPRRFTGWEDHDYCVAKGKEVYGHEYAVQFPRFAWPDGRMKRLSAVHDRTAALGAQFGPYNGYERALWYGRPGDDTGAEAQQTWRREGPWFGAVKAECEVVRDACGILDLPGFSRFRLTGAGAAEWLARQITGKVPAEGRLGLAYFADDEGRIVTEMSVARLGPEEMWLITAATAQLHDRGWLERHLAPGLTLADESADWSCQILTGPLARQVLQAAGAKADLTRPWLTHQAARIAGRDVWLARVSFAGELGWELHTRLANTPAVWDAVMAAGAPLGLRPFGMFALNALRVEKGYRAWKGDLSTDYSVLQGGLERFVDWSKPDFRGKAALAAEKQRGVAKRFCTLLIEAGEHDPPYMSTIWKDGQVVGEVTSSDWGHRVGACIGLGMLRAEVNVPGTRVEVEIFGQRVPAVVQADAPLWDPENRRLRA
jgi:dimethylglycine dehydrogenase